MDAHAGRHVFGFDLEAATAPPAAATAEAVAAGSAHPADRWGSVPLRGRNPANAFRDLPPPTGPHPFHLPLATVLGGTTVQAIQAAGRMGFTVIGDSGQKSHGAEAQEAVALHMAKFAQASFGPGRARFAYHVGDVVYFNGERASYQQQFYEAYQNYPAPIFAIPGNHDGDVPAGDTPLQGFMENFCSAQPTHSPFAGESMRTTMVQPNCYWALLTPLARIIGLNSNVPGRLDRNTTRQFDWLVDQLKRSAADRCVIVAVHHPPYSRDTAHGGYQSIDDSLDAAFKAADRIPHLVLTGHVHNYQRFERDMKPEFNATRTLTYAVAGGSGFAGYGSLHHVAPTMAVPSDVTAKAFVDDLPGFLHLEVTATEITGRYFAVPRPPHHLDGQAEKRDEFHIALG
jgi:acid phosphatase type 7